MTTELPAHLRAYQDRLYEALADNDTRAVRDASPLDQLSRLAESALPAVTPEDDEQATLLALGAIGSWSSIPEALAAADDLFGTPARFGEAIVLARCLTATPETGAALLRARRYLLQAVVPEFMTDLNTDRDAVLSFTTVVDVWQPASRTPSAVNSLQAWRDRYLATYLPGHEAYRSAMVRIAENIDGLTLRVAAIERLNSLRRLGSPVAVAALERFHELERTYACTIEMEALSDVLTSTPSCPECSFVLGLQAPTIEARRVGQAVERGLLTQQRRLAQRVIVRLLAQAQATEEQRLARFIEVVQASDLNGLALVLDDDLLDFLRRLLEPSPAQADLIERLAASFPEVTLTNLDEAITEMRRLLAEDVIQSGGSLRLGPRGG